MTPPGMLQDNDVLVEHVPLERLRARLEQLRNQGFAMLVDIGAVDFPDRALRFDLVYMVMKLPLHQVSVAEVGSPQRIRIVTMVGGEPASAPSIVDLWPNADWAEREIFDLFGVHFSGHPDLRRIQMPDDWVGHPLRRDYPLRGPGREPTPRPDFPLKSNVPSGTPASGRVAAAIAKRKAAQAQIEGFETK